jgi:hypothetical protein
VGRHLERLVQALAESEGDLAILERDIAEKRAFLADLRRHLGDQ